MCSEVFIYLFVHILCSSFTILWMSQCQQSWVTQKNISEIDKYINIKNREIVNILYTFVYYLSLTQDTCLETTTQR